MSEKAIQVQSLALKNPLEALKLALSDPPLSKDPSNKDKETFASTVSLVFYAVNQANDIKKLVQELSSKEADLAMGTIYRLMSMGGEGQNFSSAALFRWHKTLVEVFGEGCVVRHMTSREWI